MVAEPMPLKAPIPVAVRASDPLSRAGIASQLRRAQGFVVVADEVPPEDSVALVVAEEVTPEVSPRCARCGGAASVGSCSSCRASTTGRSSRPPRPG